MSLMYYVLGHSVYCSDCHDRLLASMKVIIYCCSSFVFFWQTLISL